MHRIGKGPSHPPLADWMRQRRWDVLGPLSAVSTGLRPPLCPPLRLLPDLDAPCKKGWTSAARKLDVP